MRAAKKSRAEGLTRKVPGLSLQAAQYLVERGRDRVVERAALFIMVLAKRVGGGGQGGSAGDSAHACDAAGIALATFNKKGTC